MAKRRHSFFIMTTNQLTVYRDVTSVYLDNYTVRVKVKCTSCTGTEALYRPYGP